MSLLFIYLPIILDLQLSKNIAVSSQEFGIGKVYYASKVCESLSKYVRINYPHQLPIFTHTI